MPASWSVEPTEEEDELSDEADESEQAAIAVHNASVQRAATALTGIRITDLNETMSHTLPFNHDFEA